MKFDDFIKKGEVKKSQPDLQLSNSLIKMSEQDLKFLNSLKINENSARKIMVNYYDVLRSILEAISSLEGYKIYSHEAFTYFLKLKNENLIAEKFDRFRRMRNGINYYGKSISVEEVEENKIEISKTIEILKNKYLKGGKNEN